MGRAATLSALRERVRVRADLPPFTSSSKFTSAIVDSMINEGIQDLTGIICEASDDEYLTTNTDLATTANVSTVALPSDFYKLRGLALVDGNDLDWLERMTVENMVAGDSDTRAWLSEATPRYRIVGSNIQFWPTPSAAYTVRCHYVRVIADLASDGDTFEGHHGWEEWVVLDTAIKIYNSQEMDSSMLSNRQEKVERRIIRQVVGRDEVGLTQVRDTENVYENFYNVPRMR